MRERQPYQSAILPCSLCDMPTVHVFRHGQKLLNERGTVASIETIYACSVCGHDRRWGLEVHNNPPPRIPLILEEAKAA